MNGWLEALLLGVVQGLTEFLPVSSSAHLVFGESLLGYQPPGLLLEAAVHLATTLAVIVYFRRRLWDLLVNFRSDPAYRRLALQLGAAFCVTGVIGVLLSGAVEQVFGAPSLAGAMLMITAVGLASTRWLPQGRGQPLGRISWRVALLIGLAQGAAVFPGISRSGATIIAGLWAGLDRRASAEFSFILSIPTILTASLYSIVSGPALGAAPADALLIAAAAALAVGLAAMHWLMRWLQGGKLIWFAPYCFLAGGAALLWWGFLD